MMTSGKKTIWKADCIFIEIKLPMSGLLRNDDARTNGRDNKIGKYKISNEKEIAFSKIFSQLNCSQNTIKKDCYDYL
jgi:hypothetical protein